jgi:hypothetical protein
MGQAKARKAEINQLKITPKQKVSMNSYKMTVNKPSATIKQWLLSKECPKAASTVKDTPTGCEYVIEGNVSAFSHLDTLDSMGYQVDMDPIGDSQPVKILYAFY